MRHVLQIGLYWQQKADIEGGKKGRLRILEIESSHFSRLPISLAALTANELREARAEEERGDTPYYEPDTYRVCCACRFFLRYRLPCRDVWRRHLFENAPVPEDEFARLIRPFEEVGWAAYSQEFELLPTDDFEAFEADRQYNMQRFV